MTTQRWHAIVLASASAFGGPACGSAAQSEFEQAETGQTEAEPNTTNPATPVAGITQLVQLPHGDTLTVPIDYSFKRKPGNDSLLGTLYDAAGRPVLDLDACGQAGERIDERDGTLDQAVNCPFYYGRHPESWPGLLVTYAERGPCNFIFDVSIEDDHALSIARSYTARDEPHDSMCHFDEP